MRIKGIVVELVKSRCKRTIVMEYPCDPDNYKKATIVVVGNAWVRKLQNLKVGDPLTVEFRGKWYIIRKDYRTAVAETVTM